VNPALRRHGSTLAILAVTAAAGVAYLVDAGSPTTGETLARRKNLLPTFRGDDVTEMRLAMGGRTARVFRGELTDVGQRPWQIEIDGAREPADEVAVDQLLGSLREGVVDHPIRSLSPAERTAFGLDAPRGEITLSMGSQRYRVLLGGPAPSPPGAVVVEVEGHGAAVITAQLAASLSLAPDALRKRELCTWEASDLDALALDGAGGPRHLVRAPWHAPRGESFRFDGSTAEGSVRAGAAALDRIWEAFARMKADAFLTSAEAEPASTRAVVVTLTPHSSKPVVYEVGGACPGHPDDVVAARREQGTAPVFACVPHSVEEALSLPASELVDRHLIGARADEIADLKLQEGAHVLALARSGPQWHEQTPVDRPVDPEVGRAFLERLLDVEGTFVAAPAAVDPPRATVRIVSGVGDGKEERVELLEIGAERAGQVQVRRTEDGVVASVPADAAAALFPDDLALRAKKVLDFPSADFHSLSVTGPLGTQRFERRSDGAWLLLEPHGEGLSPDAALLTELADAVGGLEAERWLGAVRPEYGLEKPRLTIAAEVGAGKAAHTIEVALGAPTGLGSFARLAGDPAVFVAPRRLETAADRWILDRAALLVDAERITAVTLVGEGGKRLVLQAHAGALQVVGAPADAASAARAAAVRDALGDLLAEGVVSVGPPDKAQGFDKPVLTVTVELGGKRLELRFGAGDSFRGSSVYYARRQGFAATFAVAQSHVRPLLDAVK